MAVGPTRLVNNRAGASRLTNSIGAFPPSKANDDKFLVFMVLKCFSWQRPVEGVGDLGSSQLL
jgi:hypothetical protein